MFLIALSTALAGPETTIEALERLEELLELRLDDGTLDREHIRPAILVSARPRYEASEAVFHTSVVQLLVRTLGDGALRICEACSAPRTWVEGGRVVYQTGPLTLDEVLRLDEGTRGEAPPARAAIWIDEHPRGVAARIADLRTGRILFAQNVDPQLQEYRNSERIYQLTEELERRARGDSLTHTFVDLALYPNQHVSIDWVDQWGKTNGNLSGFSVSLFDPILGLGFSHARRTEMLDALLGGKVLFSLPTAAVYALGESTDIAEPLLTVTGFARVPFGRSNYGLVLSASTNGRFAVGISLMNISLLPVIP